MLIIAHRGASGDMPENTVASFTKAVADGVDVIEFDVRLTKDGEVVIIHDSLLERTTNGHGRVGKHTLAQLKELKTYSGEEIPTLEEALDAIGKKVKVDIDIKEKEAVGPVVTIIQRYIANHGWKYGDFYLSAFWLFILKKALLLDRKIPLAPNITFLPRIFVSRTHSYKMKVLKFSKRALRKHLIDEAHERGQTVWVWTVDNPEEIKKYLEWGVDGIVSNFPDNVKAVAGRK